jgi:hypothetical protein
MCFSLSVFLSLLWILIAATVVFIVSRIQSALHLSSFTCARRRTPLSVSVLFFVSLFQGLSFFFIMSWRWLWKGSCGSLFFFLFLF